MNLNWRFRHKSKPIPVEGWGDDEIKFRLQMAAFAEGVPMHRIVPVVQMPDGRMAMEWIKERPSLYKWFREQEEKLLSLEADRLPEERKHGFLADSALPI